MELKRVKNPSVVQQVIDSLTEAMIQKELRPGDKIPTENELSESLGVARNSVREAIKILVFLGVLEIRRPEGTFVCNGFSESMINPMIYGIILNQGDSYDSLMELREMTEAGVLRLAMEKQTKEDMEGLSRALAQMKEAFFREPQDLQASFEADNRFHDTIMEMGRNVMVSKINNIVRILTESVRYDTVSGMITSGRADELYEAHERIYQMLCEKDTGNLNECIRGTYFL
ncbi:MAG TPA: FadR family transcriptional regulator [Candidatus Merdisoma faecalis]|nr:FadR family transcriptional regulator [Candidatus Merdisoma faecalis]